MKDESKDIQEELFDFFKDVDNKTFIEFVDAFVYNEVKQPSNVSKLTEKFLEDNGLVTAYVNEVHDNNHPNQSFLRSSLSERSILQQVRTGLLSIAYNRFRRTI